MELTRLRQPANTSIEACDPRAAQWFPGRADAHFGRHAEAEQFALGVEFCEKPAFRFAIND